MEPRPTLLIVDDEVGVGRALELGLSQVYDIDIAKTGIESLDVLNSKAVNIILLDLGLPDTNGLSHCKKLREITNAPIVILTGDSDDHKMVALLNAGADDYITKPFNIDVLAARLAAHIRRTKKTSSRIISCGQVSLDLMNHFVIINDKNVSLRPKEFELLKYLLDHADTTVTRSMIASRLWPLNQPETNAIEAQVKNLREKLNPLGHPSPIKTVYGLGYRLDSK